MEVTSHVTSDLYIRLQVELYGSDLSDLDLGLVVDLYEREWPVL